MSFSISRVLGYSGGLSTAAILFNTSRRFFDTVQGLDPFSLHTSDQHQLHIFSGMHDPYIPTHTQQRFFLEHFPQYSHLLPTSLESLRKKRALETTVKIESLANCTGKRIMMSRGPVVVGGPPALISSANQRNVIYITNEDGTAINEGSAFHLEWDAETEASTKYLPSHFFALQLLRMLFKYESLSSAEKTGQSSWRALDVTGFLTHPKHWPEGLRIALAFERVNRAAHVNRAAILNDVSLRCRANQLFYEKLNQDLGGQLLLPGRGSIIVARTKEEEESLHAMNEGLKKEGKALCFLSKEEMQYRYGFVPRGVAFAEKSHDATLSPHFMKLIAKRLETLGGQVIKGTLTKIYTDNPEQGGVIQYTISSGEKKYLSFDHLVLSLGKQRILDRDGKPLFDVISAKGISLLALVYVPENRELPPVMVCGGTNNVTKLSEGIPIEKDGKKFKVYLVRATAAACITPTVTEAESSKYDGTAATALFSAMKQTLACPIEVVAAYGCDRQVSEFGEGHWFRAPSKDETTSPFSLVPRGHHLDCGAYRPSYDKGIVIQIGAGGGGLTQGPGQPAIKA